MTIMDVTPADDSSCVLIITGPPEIGNLQLWVPEAIESNTGDSAIYSVGKPWVVHDGRFIHEVEGPGILGPGNYSIENDTVECAGIRYPLDSPVRWTTTVERGRQSVSFCLRLTNVGDQTIHKACAAICLKFQDASWWADEHVYVRSGNQVCRLSDLGPGTGLVDGFEAYLLKGESFDHVFYREFWGISRHRLDRPIMISEHPEAGLCVGVSGDRAYFLHSNKGNPCTDIMLAFGDLRPGQTAESTGEVWIRSGRPTDWLDESR
jgi:hypothetical protein